MEFYKWSVRHCILDLSNVFRFFDSYPFTNIHTRHCRMLGFLAVKFIAAGKIKEANKCLALLLKSASSLVVNPTLLDIAECIFDLSKVDPEARLRFLDLLSNLKLSEAMEEKVLFRSVCALTKHRGLKSAYSFITNKLTNEKYQNDKKVARIIRLLAEGLKEGDENFEVVELYKRFEKERKLVNGAECAGDYIAFLIRNNDERAFCDYLAWFARHKGEFPGIEQVPFIILKPPETFTEQEVILLREEIESLYFPEEAVLPLVNYYKRKISENKDKIKSFREFSVALLDLLTDAIEYNTYSEALWEQLIEALGVVSGEHFRTVDYFQRELREKMNLWIKWIFYGSLISDSSFIRSEEEMNKHKHILHCKDQLSILLIGKGNAYSKSISNLLAP